MLPSNPEVIEVLKCGPGPRAEDAHRPAVGVVGGVHHKLVVQGEVDPRGHPGVVAELGDPLGATIIITTINYGRENKRQ